MRGLRRWLGAAAPFPSPLRLSLAPRKAPFPAGAIGCSAGRAPTFVATTVKARRLISKGKETPTWMWQVALRPVAGRSGGALVDEKGRLIGLCSGGSGAESYFVPADAIASFLRANGFAELLDD